MYRNIAHRSRLPGFFGPAIIGLNIRVHVSGLCNAHSSSTTPSASIPFKLSGLSEPPIFSIESLAKVISIFCSLGFQNISLLSGKASHNIVGSSQTIFRAHTWVGAIYTYLDFGYLQHSLISKFMASVVLCARRCHSSMKKRRTLVLSSKARSTSFSCFANLLRNRLLGIVICVTCPGIAATKTDSAIITTAFMNVRLFIWVNLSKVHYAHRNWLAALAGKFMFLNVRHVR